MDLKFADTEKIPTRLGANIEVQATIWVGNRARQANKKVKKSHTSTSLSLDTSTLENQQLPDT